MELFKSKGIKRIKYDNIKKFFAELEALRIFLSKWRLELLTEYNEINIIICDILL